MFRIRIEAERRPSLQDLGPTVRTVPKNHEALYPESTTLCLRPEP